MEASNGHQGISDATETKPITIKGTNPLLIIFLFGGMIGGLVYMGSSAARGTGSPALGNTVALITGSQSE